MAVKVRTGGEFLDLEQLHEHVTANQRSIYEMTEIEMRQLADTQLRMLWSGQPQAWVMRELPQAAEMYESLLCLNHWHAVTRIQMSLTQHAESVVNNQYVSFWSLLLLRLDRLRSVRPTAVHTCAFEGLKRHLVDHYLFPYPGARDVPNIRSPLCLADLRSATMSAPEEDKDILVIEASEIEEADDNGAQPKGLRVKKKKKRCFNCASKAHEIKDCTEPRKPKESGRKRRVHGPAQARDVRCDGSVRTGAATGRKQRGGAQERESA